MDEVVLGPGLRILAQARVLRSLGHEVRLGLHSCSARLPEGIEYRKLDSALIRSIRPGDGVILHPALRIRWLWDLVRRRVPFHADFYNILSIEAMETIPLLYPRRLVPTLRRKMALRESFVARCARWIYVSHPLQRAFLGGMMADDPGDAASRLPGRCLELPMGTPSEPMPRGNPFPYPDELRGRPVFLWGGGIWSWMDPGPLLEAFALLQREGCPAALFFLAGANHSPSHTEDAPIPAARARAEALGILGRNVFFNERKAGPDDLPAYLEHCTAGILCNSDNLESSMSWRTRQLDLLWAGRPALVAGRDPLSCRMADAGAARVCPLSAEAIARLVRDFLLDPQSPSRMGEAAATLGTSLNWENQREAFASLHRASDAFSGLGPTMPWRLVFRYLAS